MIIGKANNSSNIITKKTIRSSLRLKQNNKTHSITIKQTNNEKSKDNQTTNFNQLEKNLEIQKNNKNYVANDFLINETILSNSLIQNEQAPFFVTSANFEDKTNDSSNSSFRLKLENTILIESKESIRSNLNVSTIGLWEKFRYKINNKRCYPVMCMICYHIDYNGNIRRHLKTHRKECKCKKRVNVCNCKFKQLLSISNDNVNEDKISKESSKQNLESTKKQEGNNLKKAFWMKVKTKSVDQKYYQVKCMVCGHIENNGNIRRHLKKHKKECLCKKRADSCSCANFQNSKVIIDTLELSESEKTESQINTKTKNKNRNKHEENEVGSEIFIMNPIETHSLKKHHCVECNKWFKHNEGLNEHKKRACHLNVIENKKTKFVVGKETITNKNYNDLLSEKGWISDAVGFKIEFNFLFLIFF
jgi:hypothetical protein